MLAQPEWNDEDFHVPPDRSFAELVNSIQKRLNGGGQLNGALIEDLRLYIVVRKLQELTQSQIEDELIAWGLPSDYVVKFASSTLSGAGHGTGELSQEWSTGGRGAKGFNSSPTYAQRERGAERAEGRARQAARMIAPPADPAWNFDTPGVPNAASGNFESGW